MVLTVAIGVISVLSLTSFLKYTRYDKQDFIDSDAYQAVFLTNDQIYFGRLKNISSDYLILSDVYYVKVNESGAGQLVKLGAGEPHGPRDGNDNKPGSSFVLGELESRLSGGQSHSAKK